MRNIKDRYTFPAAPEFSASLLAACWQTFSRCATVICDQVAISTSRRPQPMHICESSSLHTLMHGETKAAWDVLSLDKQAQPGDGEIPMQTNEYCHRVPDKCS